METMEVMCLIRSKIINIVIRGVQEIFVMNHVISQVIDREREEVCGVQINFVVVQDRYRRVNQIIHNYLSTEPSTETFERIKFHYIHTERIY